MPGMIPTQSMTSVPSLLKPDELFSIVKGIVNEELCHQTNAVFEFHVTVEYETKIWTIDLKNSPGCVKSGPAASAVDVTFKLKEECFQKIFHGQISATDAYMNGSLIIEGSLQTAMKLDVLVRKLKQS